MSKSTWSLILVVLLHSFFICAEAAGHLQDHEGGLDYAYSHTHGGHESESSENSDSNFEHQFHIHISCIVGYPVAIITQNGPSAAISQCSLPFVSHTSQPPIPPPNS